mgnify:CR=1 FL=1
MGAYCYRVGIGYGPFFRVAAISGFLLLIVYYLNCPPLVGLEYSLPADGSNLVVNKTLIEAIALVVLALFSTSNIFGLDAFIGKRRKKGGTKK